MEEVIQFIERYASEGYSRFEVNENINIHISGDYELTKEHLFIDDVDMANKFIYYERQLSDKGFYVSTNHPHCECKWYFLTFLPTADEHYIFYNRQQKDNNITIGLFRPTTGRAKVSYDKYMKYYKKHKNSSYGKNCSEFKRYENLIRNHIEEKFQGYSGNSVMVSCDFYNQFPESYNWVVYVKILGYNISKNDHRDGFHTVTRL